MKSGAMTDWSRHAALIASSPRCGKRSSRTRSTRVSFIPCGSLGINLCCSGALDFHPLTEFHGAIGRQLEKLRGALRLSAHDYKQMLPPARHARPAGRDDGFASEEKTRFIRINLKVLHRAMCNDSINRGCFHEPKMRDDPEETFGEIS